jgi:hypothetical protein
MIRRRPHLETGFYEDEGPSVFWERVERETLSPAEIKRNAVLRQKYLDRIETESVLPDGSPAPGSWAWRERLLRNA